MASNKNVTLCDITKANVQQVRMINSVTFPIQYSERFYKNLYAHGSLSKAAYYSDVMVGAICVRREPLVPLGKQATPMVDLVKTTSLSNADTSDVSGKQRLYIMTIGVLAAYRGLKIGSLLLNYILEKAREDPSIVEVALHVQVNNAAAERFYLKHNFEKIMTIKGYYKNISPPDCFLFVKNL